MDLLLSLWRAPKSRIRCGLEAMCSLQKRDGVFILTITGDDDHRLNPTLIDSIRSSLSRVKSESDSIGPTALITTSQGKFFSNGYDLSWALSNPNQVRFKDMSRRFRLLVMDLISLPMPTIAAVTGHASAAGFILALCHDYLLMRKDRGLLYMSELDINLKIPSWFVTIVKNKIGSPKVWRDVVLKATKITAEMGVDMGIVDSAYERVEGTVEAAVGLGMDLVRRRWIGKTYADNRRTLFAEALAALRTDETVGETTDGEVLGRNNISKLYISIYGARLESIIGGLAMVHFISRTKGAVTLPNCGVVPSLFV